MCATLLLVMGTFGGYFSKILRRNQFLWILVISDLYTAKRIFSYKQLMLEKAKLKVPFLNSVFYAVRKVFWNCMKLLGDVEFICAG